MKGVVAFDLDGTLLSVRRLRPADAAEYRALMLRTYADESEVFTATVAEREPLPLEWWRSRVADEPDAAERVFGAFDGGRLVGAAGLRLARRERTRHKAWLFGMAVLPEVRGRGVGRLLVEAVLEEARALPGVRVVQLTVAVPNLAARRLYESCGFRAFGIEPLAVRIGERCVPVVHMWCEVGGA